MKRKKNAMRGQERLDDCSTSDIRNPPFTYIVKPSREAEMEYATPASGNSGALFATKYELTI
jgi:hypothetical protein